MSAESFCSPENYSVLIPYKDLEKLVDTAKFCEQVLLQNKQILQQNEALRGLFLDCLEEIRKVKAFVRDT